ncbi:hypothetical protein XENOCAPTIV_007884 [Xenoophorus captivus]|uniref:Uncharacterized protein n=1 Tax=Xenoophorus captivus TaxID=1517983 RepID=A0ABV0QZD5_9TELE
MSWKKSEDACLVTLKAFSCHSHCSLTETNRPLADCFGQWPVYALNSKIAKRFVLSSCDWRESRKVHITSLKTQSWKGLHDRGKDLKNTLILMLSSETGQ